MAKKVYLVENLDCANCAAKVEAALGALPEVQEAVLTYATMQLRITAEDPDALLPKLQEVAQKVEPGVEFYPRDGAHSHSGEQEHHHDCCCGHDHEHEHCHDHHHDDDHEHDHEDEHHHDHGHDHGGEEAEDLKPLLVGAALFAVGLVLEHFGLAPYFEAICGAPGDNTQAGKKVNVIRAALQKAGCTDLTQAMIVGDRKHDIIGGKLAGIRTAGILYGYGSQEELAQAGADLICWTPEEFTKIMLSEQQGDKRMNATERKIAEDLLSIRAVFFRPDEPFTWASGIKSPVYCDNRLILTAPDVRTEVETAIMQTIEREYPQAEVLMGTSTAGIAHAAIVGHMMKLPMGYVRGSSKDHGRQNQIEGRLEKGQKVVVVEDLVSTGGSVLDVVKVLRAAGAEVLGVVSIFTYSMKKGLERMAAANVKNVSLTNFDVIAAVAAEQNYIKQEDVVRLIQFRNNPADESWIGGNN